MDKLGDWVYIILMVVVGIGSLISSINKKKAQQQTQIPEQELPEQTFSPPPTPQKKSKMAPPPVPGPFKPRHFGSRIPSPGDESRIQTEIALAPDIETALADELDLADAESFRKAIIYSEIIKRKY